MCNIIIIDELTHGLIMAPGHHAARRLLGCEFLLVGRLVAGVGREAADHLLVLAHPDPLPLEQLHVFQAAEHFVLHDEDGLHLVPAAFFDVKGFVLERLHCAGGGHINRDIRSALDFLGGGGRIGLAKRVVVVSGGQEGRGLYQRERFDHAFARVVGIADGLARSQTQ
jgi:hypothetical protein